MKIIVKVKQWTIIKHVDDLNMLHVNSKIVSIFISEIDTEYGVFTKMTITRGKIQKYLNMTTN